MTVCWLCGLDYVVCLLVDGVVLFYWLVWCAGWWVSGFVLDLGISVGDLRYVDWCGYGLVWCFLIDLLFGGFGCGSVGCISFTACHFGSLGWALGCSFGCCAGLGWVCVCMMTVSVFCVCWICVFW